MSEQRRAVSLVYDAEEYLYPIAVFEDEADAERVRKQLIEELLEHRRAKHEAEREDGDIDPATFEQRERDWLEQHIHHKPWSDVPLVLSGESVDDAQAMAMRSLTDYISPDDDIWEALF